MKNVLPHVGTWAPRAEQIATAKLLDDPMRSPRSASR